MATYFISDDTYTVQVDVSVVDDDDNDGGTNLQYTLTWIPDGDGDGGTPDVNGDLRGFFFNLDTTGPVQITGADVTEYKVDFDDPGVWKVGNDVNMGGVENSEGNKMFWDIGVEFGTQGIAEDDIQTTSFIVDAGSTSLTLDDVMTDSGVRVNSVSEVGGDREDSLKLFGGEPPVLDDGAVVHDETAGQDLDADDDAAVDTGLVNATESALDLGLNTLTVIGQATTALNVIDEGTGIDSFVFDLGSAVLNGNTTTDGTALVVIYESDELIVIGTDATTPILSYHLVDIGIDGVADEFVVVQYDSMAHDDSPANYDEGLTSTMTVDVTASNLAGSSTATITVDIQDDGPRMTVRRSTMRRL
jgi:hypothetical protein